MDVLTTDLAAKVGVNVISEIFKGCLKGVAQADEWLRTKNSNYDPFGLAAQKYIAKIEERYNSMRIFGMHKPVPLRNIYTRVNILEKLTSGYRVSVEELNQNMNFHKKSFGQLKETKDGMETVNSLNMMTVLGKPGAGKTTFLKYIALQAVDGKLVNNRIPIFISLKDWSESNVNLISFIIEQFDICDFPDSSGFVKRILGKGKFLILFDGFDEVVTNQEKAIKEIRNFTEKYSKNQFILSCRLAAYNYCFEKFTDIEIADFSDDQIEVFIKNWFGTGTPKANKCLSQVTLSPSIREIAGTPLLLTILCLAFDENMTFPTNRSELYKEGIDALLKKWDSSRSISRADVYKNLSLRRKESLLSRIANKTFQANMYFFKQSSLERFILDYIKNLPEMEKDSLELDSEVILHAIEAQHGLFVERAKGIYSFSHLTFQEYFTAKYIVDNSLRGTLWHLVDTHIISVKWREVFLLVAGLLEDASQFITSMHRKIKSLELDHVFSDNVLLILRVLNKNNNHRLSGAGLAAFSLLTLLDLSSLKILSERRLNEIRSCMVILKDILKLIEPERFSDGNINVVDFAELKKLSIEDHNLIDIAVENIRDCKFASTINYLEANRRLIECISTDCYVRRELREEILNSFLL